MATPASSTTRASDSRTELLDAAEVLFYEKGFQAVGMDELRAASGVPLKRIYATFPSKEALAVAMLARRDDHWHASLEAEVERHEAPDERVLAVYEWLGAWLGGQGHRGCAWINAHGELGGTSEAIRAAARVHKARFRRYLTDLVTRAGHPEDVADALFLLAEGAMVTAGIAGSAEAAAQARRSAQLILRGASG